MDPEAVAFCVCCCFSAEQAKALKKERSDTEGKWQHDKFATMDVEGHVEDEDEWQAVSEPHCPGGEGIHAPYTTHRTSHTACSHPAHRLTDYMALPKS